MTQERQSEDIEPRTPSDGLDDSVTSSVYDGDLKQRWLDFLYGNVRDVVVDPCGQPRTVITRRDQLPEEPVETERAKG